MLLSRLFGRRDVCSTRRMRCRRRLSVEALEGRQLLAAFTVTNVNDNGVGSLRQAILSSNALSGTSVNSINFQIASGGVETIELQSELPAVIHPVTIDGTTEPGTGSAPRIVLDGKGAGSGVSGISFNKSDSTLKGVAVDNFSEYGLVLYTGSSNTIIDDYVGLTPAGNAAGNGHNGVLVCTNASHNTITGNVISDNGGNGVEICSGANHNVVTGNLVGTTPNGSAALPNSDAVKIEGNAYDNTIGGTATSAGNVLSGNRGSGVEIDSASGNVIVGNLVGTSASGTTALANGLSGVLIEDGSHGNVIGGTAPGAGNVLSGQRRPRRPDHHRRLQQPGRGQPDRHRRQRNSRAR